MVDAEDKAGEGMEQEESPATSIAASAPPPRFAFIAVVVGLFFCVALATALRHELWRDEMEHWLVASDSSSLSELLENRRYSAHPLLWHLCLFAVSRLTASPVAMQVFHVLVASAAVYVFVRFAPFRRYQKVLFAFGYFALYEYGVISRDYALGVLLLFCFCALFPGRRKRYLGLASVLFLLAQTNALSLIISLALVGLLVLEGVFDKELRSSLSRRKAHACISAAIVVVGVVVSLMQLMPPADSCWAGGWRTNLDVDRAYYAVTTVWRSWVPVPALTREFWNSNIVASVVVQERLSLVLLALVALCLVGRPRALFAFVLGTGALLVFLYTRYFGYLRHHGHLYLMLVVSVWLAAHVPEWRPRSAWLAGIVRRAGRCRNMLFSVLLVVHVGAGLFAVAMDWRYPFSASKATAAFIKERGLDTGPIVADMDNATQSVVGYLDRPVYSVMANRLSTFVVWRVPRRCWGTPEETVEAAQALSAEQRADVLILVNYGLSELDYPALEFLAHFGGTVVVGERYWLYLVKYDPDAPVQ
jgi:hypothetical protein